MVFFVGVFLRFFQGKGIISHTKISVESQEEQKQNCGAGVVFLSPHTTVFLLWCASEDTQGALAKAPQHSCISEMRGGRFSQSSSEGKYVHVGVYLEVKEIKLRT